MLNIDALTKLSAYLRTIESVGEGEGYITTYGETPVAFDLGTWFGSETATHSHCGFAACAIGHGILAGIIPGVVLSEFNRDKPREYLHDIYSADDLAKASVGSLYTLRDAAEGTASGERTARMFLGMSYDEFKQCFYVSGYEVGHPTPSMVADRINALLAKHGAAA